MTAKLIPAFFALLSVSLLPSSNAEEAVRAPPTVPGPQATETDSEELAQMYTEDQSDRKPAAGQPIDWKIVGPRDKAREARVKELYTANQLKTGNDYQRAAMVLQHASKPEDYLLAHELCVIAIFKGVDARWLAAASEDRFLRSIGRPQRFGTQSGKIGNSPWSLGAVDESLVDAHRAEMKVPSLEKAKARIAQQNGSPEHAKEPSQTPSPAQGTGP